MNFLVPQGIGDSIWALLKVQSIAAGEPINIFIACIDKNNSAEARSLDFVRRFKFVNSAEMYEMPMNGNAGCVLQSGPPADEDGLYRYISEETVLPGIDYILIPNGSLERGIRLEDWQPGYDTNWKVMDDFSFDTPLVSIENYVVFFMSSAESNTISGHNRNGIWSPLDWVELGECIQEELGCKIVVVGASYDRSYYSDYVQPLLNYQWIDLIGQLGIGQTYSTIKGARFVISYQSGIGIVANYMGVPAGIFWRAKGDSISPHSYISFDERMAEAWVNPVMIEQGKYLPLIYGRHGVEYIVDEIKKRAW